MTSHLISKPTAQSDIHGPIYYAYHVIHKIHAGYISHDTNA